MAYSPFIGNAIMTLSFNYSRYENMKFEYKVTSEFFIDNELIDQQTVGEDSIISLLYPLYVFASNQPNPEICILFPASR